MNLIVKSVCIMLRDSEAMGRKFNYLLLIIIVRFSCVACGSVVKTPAQKVFWVVTRTCDFLEQEIW
jgi:hypothetical protein